MCSVTTKKTRQTFCCDFIFFLNEISVLYLELDLEMERKISYFGNKKSCLFSGQKSTNLCWVKWKVLRIFTTTKIKIIKKSQSDFPQPKHLINYILFYNFMIIIIFYLRDQSVNGFFYSSSFSSTHLILPTPIPFALFSMKFHYILCCFCVLIINYNYYHSLNIKLTLNYIAKYYDVYVSSSFINQMMYVVGINLL